MFRPVHLSVIALLLLLNITFSNVWMHIIYHIIFEEKSVYVTFPGN